MGTLISYHHNRSVRHHGDPVTSFGRMLNSSAALATASSPSYASMMPRCWARARRMSTDHHGTPPPLRMRSNRHPFSSNQCSADLQHEATVSRFHDANSNTQRRPRGVQPDRRHENQRTGFAEPLRSGTSFVNPRSTASSSGFGLGRPTAD